MVKRERIINNLVLNGCESESSTYFQAYLLFASIAFATILWKEFMLGDQEWSRKPKQQIQRMYFPSY